MDTGGDFPVENPSPSLIWSTQKLQHLQHQARAFPVHMDQCFCGAPSQKPTTLLKGKVFSQRFGRVVFQTRLAQEYPISLCKAMAKAIWSIWARPLELVQPSFSLQNHSARKRPLGQAAPWAGHKQAKTAAIAQASGYQLKRGAQKPLLHVETEPGQAIEWALSIHHPFSSEIELPANLENVLTQFEVPSEKSWSCERSCCASGSVLRSTPWKSPTSFLVPPLLRLLRGVPDGHPAQLGTTCHLVLYKLMLHDAIGPPDQQLPICYSKASLSSGPSPGLAAGRPTRKSRSLCRSTRCKAGPGTSGRRF